MQLTSGGTVLQIKCEMRNRLMDRAARSDARYVLLLENALVVSTLIDPRTYNQDIGRSQSGMVWERKETEGWHHGGLATHKVLPSSFDLPRSFLVAFKAFFPGFPWVFPCFSTIIPGPSTVLLRHFPAAFHGSF